MSANIPHTPTGGVVNIGIPDSQDIPRLVYTAPYFAESPLAELIEPSVIEAVNNVLPSLVPQYVDAAAQAAVQQLAVLKTGSTMTGPLNLSPLMPTQDPQAASKAYVDAMVATAGVPEVPPVPSGQTWARQTGQWVPIDTTGGVFLPLAGGSMTGNINMNGNTITNMGAVPAMPNGAAPAQWVLNQIAAVSLYQGTWNADTNAPDLTQLSYRVNGYTWFAITTNPAGVVVTEAIPGLQGVTVFNGDTIIYSTVHGQFQAIHAGGLTLPEADARYVQLAGSQMSGALLLNANASQPLQATPLQQVQSLIAGAAFPEPPGDGQLYGRNGATSAWAPVLPLAGGIMTGNITLYANATQAMQPTTLQQVNSSLSQYLPLGGGTLTGALTLSGNAVQSLQAVPLQQLNTYVPLAGATMTGLLTLSGNASANLNPVPLQQLNTSVSAIYQTLSNPNKFINPFMEVDQANEGAAVNPTNANLYVVDGIRASTTMSSGTATAQRTATAPTGYTYSATLGTVTAMTSVAAADQQSLSAPLDGDELVDTGFGTAGAKSLTLSFWATATLAGTYYVGIRNAPPSNRSYVTPFTIATANAWQLFVITIPGDTAGTWVVSGNAVAMYISWTTSAGTNNQTPTANTWVAGGFSGITGMSNAFATTGGSYFRLGPCKLEVGTQATPMLRPSFQQELARCQRYYEKSYDLGVALGTVSANNGYAALTIPVATASTGYGIGKSETFATRKRTDPTITLYSSTGAIGHVRDQAAGTDITGNTQFPGQGGFSWYGIAGATTNQVFCHWVADARL